MNRVSTKGPGTLVLPGGFDCFKPNCATRYDRAAIHRVYPKGAGTLVLPGGFDCFKPNCATRYVRAAIQLAYPMIGVYPELSITLFQAAAINAYLNFGVSRAKVACSKA
jgi:hypothetical protein